MRGESLRRESARATGFGMIATSRVFKSNGQVQGVFIKGVKGGIKLPFLQWTLFVLPRGNSLSIDWVLATTLPPKGMLDTVPTRRQSLRLASLIAFWLPQFQDMERVDRELSGALVDVFGGAQTSKEACDRYGLDGVSLGERLSQTLDSVSKTASFYQATGEYLCTHGSSTRCN